MLIDKIFSGLKIILNLIVYSAVIIGIFYKIFEGTDNRSKIADAVLYSHSAMPEMTAALTVRFPVNSKPEAVSDVFQPLGFKCQRDTNKMICKGTLNAAFPCGTSMTITVDIDKKGLLSQIHSSKNTVCL